MIKGLAHLCFVVEDLASAEAFYNDVLGFETAFDFVSDEGRRFGVYLKISGRNFIELFEGKGARPGEGLGYHHLCLETDDIEATVRQLREKGVEVSEPKFMEADGSFQAWFADSEGNKIELHQYTAESKQMAWLS
jgi:lactoylglutathione lyase